MDISLEPAQAKFIFGVPFLFQRNCNPVICWCFTGEFGNGTLIVNLRHVKHIQPQKKGRVRVSF
jgi:hypothetical protein